MANEEKEKKNLTAQEAEVQENTSAANAENIAQQEKSDSKKPDEKQKKSPKAKKKFNVRSFRHGTLSVVFTVIFIAAVVVLNVIVGIISERIDTTADLTDTGFYTLDEDAENYLKETLAGDVTLTVLASESDFEGQGTYYKQINEILKKMEMASDHVTLKYIDLNQNPNYSSQFKGESLAAGYIVVESEQTGRHRILTRADYFDVNSSIASYDSSIIEQYIEYYGSVCIEGSNIEQAAVSAMMYVSNSDLVRVAFTEGYGEEDSSALQNMLSKNGYDVLTVNLTTDEIPQDVDFVVVFGPQYDIDNENLTKLDKFVDNGGEYGKTVFYFASVNQEKTPNIDAFLADWGFEIGYSAVGQSDSSYLISSYTSYAHLQQILETPYTSLSYASNLYTFGAYLRPVMQIWGDDGSRGGVEQQVLMTTYDNAFLCPLDLAEDAEFSLDTAESGTFIDAAVAYRLHSTTQELSTLAVFGSTELASSSFMSTSNANNQDFFINMFNYISGKEDGIFIKSKAVSSVTFEMSAQTANTLAIVLCVAVPVLVIVVGIVIWVRRRHR